MYDTVKSLYVHVPFCQAKCRYCDFYSLDSNDDGLVDLYLKALARELEIRGSVVTLPLDTIFIGGGTPTSLSSSQLSQLLEVITPLCDGSTEFTMESNPGTLTQEKISIILDGGVNRISLGVQSFCDNELKMLGRIHNSAQAVQAAELLRSCGVKNINLDLIYALPGQTLSHWQETLTKAVALAPEHISCYALSYEKGTAFYDQLIAGEFIEQSDDDQEETYYATAKLLTSHGYEHYEISNFARSDRRCRHNLIYWHNGQYLGLGPAAASYIDAKRLTNHSDINSWCENILEKNVPGPMEIETPSLEMQMAETLMLGLRLTEGVCLRDFEKRFSKTLQDAFPNTLKKHLATGGVTVESGRIHVSRDKLFVSNEVLADFISEARAFQT